MKTHDSASAEKIDALISSLELISARMLQITTANNQLASWATPEMRQLFDRWTRCISDEIVQLAETEDFLDVKKISAEMGLTPQSFSALMLALDRQGFIEIEAIRAKKGDGLNKDICDCMQQT